MRAPDRSSCEVLMCNLSSPPDTTADMIAAGLTATVSSESDSDADSEPGQELLERLDSGLARLARNLARFGVDMDPDAVRKTSTGG